jgi:hypothetical protein
MGNHRMLYFKNYLFHTEPPHRCPLPATQSSHPGLLCLLLRHQACSSCASSCSTVCCEPQKAHQLLVPSSPGPFTAWPAASCFLTCPANCPRICVGFDQLPVVSEVDVSELWLLTAAETSAVQTHAAAASERCMNECSICIIHSSYHDGSSQEEWHHVNDGTPQGAAQCISEAACGRHPHQTQAESSTTTMQCMTKQNLAFSLPAPKAKRQRFP